MKNVILTAITALMLLSTSAWCTVITVSNLPNSPGQYFFLQDAIDASSDGDTLLVSGSPDSYGSVIVIRPLTIIGDGYNRRPSPDNSNYYPDGYNSIAAFDIQASNVHISGFRTQIKIHDYYGLYYIGNITIERCLIDDNFGEFDKSVEVIASFIESTLFGNIKFINNVFAYQGEISFQYLFGIDVQITFSNNIFFGTIFLSSNPFGSIRNMVFMHNNFFDANNTEIFNSDVFTNMVIKDNIFYNSSPLGCVQSAYINNLLFGIDTIFPNEDHADAGNIFADPSFMVYTDSLDFFEQNFNLNPDSEACNAASDGTDIGITGGAYPFNVGDTPSWAEVIKLKLSDSTIPTNATINATFEGKVNN